ncbi:MAG: hypothetical protein ABJK89_13630 [Paracoccaceae bacterium]
MKMLATICVCACLYFSVLWGADYIVVHSESPELRRIALWASNVFSYFAGKFS